MKKLDILNKNNFRKHTERKFNKDIMIGRWLVWKNTLLWAEFVFEISGRFVEIKQGTEKVGNWLYLPDLQIINISFRNDDSSTLNFYIWYDTENGSLMLEEYEQELPSRLHRLFLLKKGLLSDYYQAKAQEIPLNTFVNTYQTDVKVQNEIEHNLINQKLGVGCSIFGLMAVLSLILVYGAILAWLILGIVYLFWGQKSIKEQLNKARQRNNFGSYQVLGLDDTDYKVGSFNQKKFIYGLISFVVMAFIILNIIR